MNSNQLPQLPPQSPLPQPTTVAPRPVQASPKRVLLGISMPVLGSLIASLDQQMTNACLKDVQGGLGFSADEATWVTIAYLSAELLSIPLAGYLNRAFSRRWYLSISAVVFVLASLACTLAWDLPSFLVCRLVQGFVAGVFLVTALTVVLTQMPRSKQHIGLVMIGITSSLPTPIAQLIAGAFVDHYSWQYFYYLNIPLGLLVLWGLWVWLEPQPLQLAVLEQLDWLGVVLLSVSLTCLMIVLQRGNTENWFDSELIVQLSMAAGLLLTLFCVWELSIPNPLVDLHLLGQRNFGLINIVNFSVGLVLAYTFVLPQYLGQIQGYNTFQIGEVLIWGAVVNPFIPKMVEHIEARLVFAIGLSIFVTSCFMNASLSLSNSGEQLVMSQVVRAIGQPVLVVAVSYIATAGVKREQADSISAIYNGIRVIGTTAGTAFLGTVLTRREQFHSNRIVEAVSNYNTQTQDRIQQLSQSFVSKLGDPAAAQTRAISAMGQTVRQQAFIIAYSDCFYVIGISLLLVSLFVLMLKRTTKPTQSEHQNN